MINHTVLFKIKPEASEAQVKQMIDNLLALKNEITEIEAIHIGENFSDRSQGHDLMLYTLFKDKDALGKYAVHPAHVAVLEQDIKPILAGITVGDIEF
ncbi:Dabb family protein [Limibacter armeniacum]|uniref:Dabb family protein n=1 Tax=Limibacter armeniacum TaxID=466084 RepID=UPI002FE66604